VQPGWRPSTRPECTGTRSASGASISADGRFVAYFSFATNLVAGDTNSAPDVFVHDLVARTTERVSVGAAGAQANAGSTECSISASGRYVAFVSGATNLVAGDTNGWADVFVRDRVAKTTVRVSVDSSGGEADADSQQPSISADGRFVAFSSDATDLVAGDTNGYADAFVHDLVSGRTVRASLGSSGVEADDFAWHPVLSSDGRLVAFTSRPPTWSPETRTGTWTCSSATSSRAPPSG
jgi:Tol biopolymer transport system component